MFRRFCCVLLCFTVVRGIRIAVSGLGALHLLPCDGIMRLGAPLLSYNVTMNVVLCRFLPAIRVAGSKKTELRSMQAPLREVSQQR